MIWRSTAQPDFGWGWAIAVVFAGIAVPAVPAFLLLWGWEAEARYMLSEAPFFERSVWFVATGLAVAPAFFWIAVPVATPLVRATVRRGWAGPGVIAGMGLFVGLPLAHWFFNGDLTRETPAMIPVLAGVFLIQSLSVWFFLWIVSRWRLRARKTAAA